jgi:DNA-binding response OmpR family regulator
MNRSFTTFFGETLVDGGFTVAQASTASDALGMIEAPKADYRALVTDINLNPGHKTGWDIAKRARECQKSRQRPTSLPLCGRISMSKLLTLSDGIDLPHHSSLSVSGE